jgi:hypothetical protein
VAARPECRALTATAPRIRFKILRGTCTRAARITAGRLIAVAAAATAQLTAFVGALQTGRMVWPRAKKPTFGSDDANDSENNQHGDGHHSDAAQCEFLPFPAQLEFAIVSDVASVTASVFSGSDVLLENGDVPVKSTAPVYPDDYFLSDVANAGERINISLRNNNAGTATVRSAVRIYPLQ